MVAPPMRRAPRRKAAHTAVLLTRNRVALRGRPRLTAARMAAPPTRRVALLKARMAVPLAHRKVEHAQPAVLPAPQAAAPAVPWGALARQKGRN